MSLKELIWNLWQLVICSKCARRSIQKPQLWRIEWIIYKSNNIKFARPVTLGHSVKVTQKCIQVADKNYDRDSGIIVWALNITKAPFHCSKQLACFKYLKLNCSLSIAWFVNLSGTDPTIIQFDLPSWWSGKFSIIYRVYFWLRSLGNFVLIWIILVMRVLLTSKLIWMTIWWRWILLS